MDAPIVQRSACSLEEYGPDFTYSHNLAHASLFHMAAAAVVFGAVRFLMRYAPCRAFF